MKEKCPASLQASGVSSSRSGAQGSCGPAGRTPGVLRVQAACRGPSPGDELPEQGGSAGFPGRAPYVCYLQGTAIQLGDDEDLSSRPGGRLIGSRSLLTSSVGSVPKPKNLCAGQVARKQNLTEHKSVQPEGGR